MLSIDTASRCAFSHSAEKLYDRETELKALRTAYEAVVLDGGGSENTTITSSTSRLIFVQGRSGTGKTTLVRQAFAGVIFGYGKFDQETSMSPFSAIISCMSNLKQQINENKGMLRQNKESESFLNMNNSDERGAPTLKDTISVKPDLSDKTNNRPFSATTDTIFTSGKSLDSLKYSIRSFLEEIGPCVVCLDDIQWVDPASLSILEFLWSDAGLTNVLFVSLLRDIDVTSDHVLYKWCHQKDEKYKDKSSEENIYRIDHPSFKGSITVVKVLSLRKQAIIEMIADMLRRDIDDKDLLDLADLIYTRTDGNVFYTLQLIDFLQTRNLLNYSFVSMRWMWDIALISEETSLSSNMVDIVLARMQHLSDSAMKLLQLCCFLGFIFDRLLLDILNDDADFDFTYNHQDLEELVEKNLLDTVESTRIKFAHDKTFEAAAQSNSNTVFDATHYGIGMVVWQHFQLDKFIGKIEDGPTVNHIPDDVIFIVADHFSKGISIIKERKDLILSIINLYLIAGKRAANKSSFVSAVEFLYVAHCLLDDIPNQWRNHYEACMEVESLIAEYTIGAGLLTKHNAAAELVLKNKKCTVDAARVYIAHLQLLYIQGNTAKYTHFALCLLQELGEDIEDRIPSKSVKRYQKQAKKVLQSFSRDSINKLPVVKDPKTIFLTHLLDEFYLAFASFDRADIVIYCCLRLMQITLEKGISPFCSTAFTGASIALHDYIDFDLLFEAALAGEIILEQLKSHESNDNNTIAHVRVCRDSVMLMHWKTPMGLALDKALVGFRLAMQAGDTADAFLFVNMYCYHYFYSGLPLGPLIRDLRRFILLMENFGNRYQLLQCLPTFQATKNLAGLSDNIMVIHQDEAAEFRKRGWPDRYGEHVEFGQRMQIAFYCNNLRLATEMYYKALDARSTALLRIQAFYPPRVFFFALICFANFKAKGKRKWKKKGKAYYSMIEGWVKGTGAINLVHKLKILEAEIKSLDNKRSDSHKREVKHHYDEAISFSARAGFVQDAGLASWLASKTMKNDSEIRDQYVVQTLHFYRLWGADGLVQYLQEHDHSVHSVSSPGEDNEANKGYKGREHYDASLVQQLNSSVSSGLRLSHATR